MSESKAVLFQNPDTREYWAAVQDGRLVFQKCSACGASYVYPRPYCVRCFSDDVRLVNSLGRGEIHAKTVVHIPAMEGGATGYPVVLVELAEGIRMLARYAGDRAVTGQPVHITWDRSGERPILIASPAERSPES